MELNEKELKKLVEEEVSAKMAGDRDEESKTEEKAESKVSADVNLDDMVSNVAKSLVDAIQSEIGGDKKDAEKLKEKIYTEEEGLKLGSSSDKNLDDLSDDEKIATFVSSLYKSSKSVEDLAIVKGLSEGTPADGGYLVPTPLANRVWELLPDMAVMRKLAEVMPMDSQTLKLNYLDDARGKAYWIQERKTKTTTSAQFGQVTLTANVLVARLLMSDQVVADANVALVPYITQQLAQYIATAEDDAFFTGSGTNQPRGISIETIGSIATGGTLNFDSVINLMYKVRQSVRSNKTCAFVGHQSVIQKLRRVKDSNNNYLWQGITSPQTGEMVEMLYGRKLYEQNDLADSELYFGDWKKYIIGQRAGMTMKMTDQTETAWTENAVDMKVEERVDGRAVMLGAFAKLTGI